MNVRTTLTHPVLGSQQISPPDGWKEAKFKMERHRDGHSLVEYFNGSFIFYGTNGVEDGGINFLISVIDTYGFDAEVSILFEISFDNTTYPLSFSGLLDLENMEHMPKNKMMVPVLRDDLWQRFQTRFDTPVDLTSTRDLDDNVISPTEDIVLSLPSQVIQYQSDYRGNESYTYPVSGATLAAYITVGWFTELIGDIKIGGVYLKENEFTSIVPTFFAPWDGSYVIEIKFLMSNYNPVSGLWQTPHASTEFYLQKRNGSPIQFTKTTPLANNANIFTLNTTLQMVAGESVIIYGDDDPLVDQDLTILGEVRWVFHAECDAATTTNITLSGTQSIDGYSAIASDRILVKDQNDSSENGVWVVSAGAWSRATDMNSSAEFELAAVYIVNGDINADTSWKQINGEVIVDTDPVKWEFMLNSEERFKLYTGITVENYIKITAETIFDRTTAEGYLIHDAGAGIMERITGENAFYSEFFGSQSTLQRQYDDDGCAWKYALAKFLQIRQYTLDEKPYFQSMKQWWDGANPIFNIGFGYDIVSSVPVIRFEPKSFFYADETPLVNFSNVELSKRFDSEFIYNKIRTGFKKWESEDTSGIDDPQTKQTRANDFKRSGSTLEIYSEFIAASLTIETGRRTTREKSEDYKYDNDVAIIAVTDSLVSPDGYYTPELDENFTSVSGLNNSDTRYNIRLTPARSFLRWLNMFNGFMQKYLTSVWRFVSAEGNYDVVTQMSGSDCDSSNYGGAALSENENISPDTDYLFIPEEYEGTVDMTYEQYLLIQQNRTYPIGISQTDENHASFYIKDLEYEPFKSKAKLLVWPKQPFTLTIPEDEFTQQC